MTTARDSAFPLRGAMIVVGVAGGIAAYKAAMLVRLLDKAGAIVRVVMTKRAQEFITPLTFQALTRHAVFTDLFSLTEEASIGHIQLADQADLVIIAPATASTIARLAAGSAENALDAVVLATKAPVLLAPSMNVNMWSNPLTVANVARLIDVAGYRTVGPGNGFLACQWVGPGRMSEPADIVEAAATILTPQDLAGRRVVVSAGPTHEAIDPARYVANRSSGKMGYAIAAVARRRGAQVTLISGPTALAAPIGVDVVHAESALAMRDAMKIAAATPGVDVVISTAAVADYRPAQAAKQKIKRQTLVANPDILAEVGQVRGNKRTPLLVGFAAETENVVENARKKLVSKRCDLVIANDVSATDAGFAVDENRVVIVSTDAAIAVALAPKSEIAFRILDAIVDRLTTSKSPARKAPKSAPRRPVRR